MGSALGVSVKSDHVSRSTGPLIGLAKLDVRHLLPSGWPVDVPRLDGRNLWIAFVVGVEARVLLLMNLVD